jgi:hypothetical protein
VSSAGQSVHIVADFYFKMKLGKSSCSNRIDLRLKYGSYICSHQERGARERERWRWCVTSCQSILGLVDLSTSQNKSVSVPRWGLLACWNRSHGNDFCHASLCHQLRIRYVSGLDAKPQSAFISPTQQHTNQSEEPTRVRAQTKCTWIAKGELATTSRTCNSYPSRPKHRLFQQ